MPWTAKDFEPYWSQLSAFFGSAEIAVAYSWGQTRGPIYEIGNKGNETTTILKFRNNTHLNLLNIGDAFTVQQIKSLLSKFTYDKFFLAKSGHFIRQMLLRTTSTDDAELDTLDEFLAATSDLNMRAYEEIMDVQSLDSDRMQPIPLHTTLPNDARDFKEEFGVQHNRDFIETILMPCLQSLHNKYSLRLNILQNKKAGLERDKHARDTNTRKQFNSVNDEFVELCKNRSKFGPNVEKELTMSLKKYFLYTQEQLIQMSFEEKLNLYVQEAKQGCYPQLFRQEVLQSERMLQDTTKWIEKSIDEINSVLETGWKVALKNISKAFDQALLPRTSQETIDQIMVIFFENVLKPYFFTDVDGWFFRDTELEEFHSEVFIFESSRDKLDYAGMLDKRPQSKTDVSHARYVRNQFLYI